MASSLWLTKSPEYYPLPTDDSSPWNIGMKALLIVCSHRVWRGGPRSLLQIALVVFTLVVLFYFVPLQLGDSYQTILNWSTSPESGVTGANLRIVVFGSQDVLGSAPDAQHSRTTWPEHLCKQLNCSSLLSFVPHVESRPGLTSNGLYGNELLLLRELNQEANITDRPASDNLYIPEQYPVPVETPDLEAQVNKFLAMPPPEVAPRETLWVFTFGTWDVWNLAAMPRESGDSLIDATVSHLFSQIELLYRKSLDPASIAFSDFWINASEAEIMALAQPDITSDADKLKMENFRVLIPELFDITLAPGWQKRPLPSYPQTSGVQLRDAAHLTQRWNSKVASEMRDWMRKANFEPKGMEDETFYVSIEAPATPDESDDDNDGDDGDDEVIYAPYPWRTGLQSIHAGKILDSITEEDMRRSGLTDSKGRGTMPPDAAMRFLDVWTPCVAGGRRVVAVENGQIGGQCEVPNDHLFHDDFTVGERAAEELAKETADLIWERLFGRQ